MREIAPILFMNDGYLFLKFNNIVDRDITINFQCNLDIAVVLADNHIFKTRTEAQKSSVRFKTEK